MEEARTSRTLSSVVHSLQSKPSEARDEAVPPAEPEPSPDLGSPEHVPFRGGSPPFITGALKPGKNYIDVGEGPAAVPEFHAVIELPGRKRQTNITRANRKWKSLFGKRPDNLKASPGSSFKRPPARQRSYENPANDNVEKVGIRSQSVDELSRTRPFEEIEKGKGLLSSNIVSRPKFIQQITGSGSGTSKSKFYLDTDLPLEGIRGTFVKSDVELSFDPRKGGSEASKQGIVRSQPPSRPSMSPLPHGQQSADSSSSRPRNSPLKSKGTESTFFVAGRVNQQTNTKTVEVFRAPSIQSLKTGRSVTNEESTIASEGRVPLPSKE